MKGRRLISSHLITAIGIWVALTTTLVFIIGLSSGKPVTRAVICMGFGLVVLWIAARGTLMRLFRDRVRAVVLAVPWKWQVKFVLFCTLLALIEEAITTAMTNLAPVFGVPIGKTYITASANYLDVVAGHSVIVFIPMFIAWACLLSHFDFTPDSVFLLFGLTGALAEAGTFGFQHLAEAGFWIFVYGLMIYLPAYSLPHDRNTGPPQPKHYFLAVFLPFLFVIPVAGVVSVLHPVKIHFPPIVPDT